MSTAKAPAAPSDRICEKQNISACKHPHINEYNTMKPSTCSKFEVILLRTS